MTSIREELDQKLNKLASEKLNSVHQFEESLATKTQPEKIEQPITNEDIDRIVESYKKQGKKSPIGLAKGQFTIPDDFNDPLPDEILDLFEFKS